MVRQSPSRTSQQALAPAAVDPHVVASSTLPAARNPNGARARRLDVVAGNPNVGSAVPALKSRLPYPVPMSHGTHWNDLSAARRWAYAYGDLRLGCAACEKSCKSCGDNFCVHDCRSPLVLPARYERRFSAEVALLKSTGASRGKAEDSPESTRPSARQESVDTRRNTGRAARFPQGGRAPESGAHTPVQAQGPECWRPSMR